MSDIHNPAVVKIKSAGGTIVVTPISGIGIVNLESAGGGSGTVTIVSIVSANGISGSVANPTTTPAITLTVNGQVPIGCALAYLKQGVFTGLTPSLPTGFIEMNGQTLSDAGSVYNGVVIPNFNSGNPSDPNNGVMLRGACSGSDGNFGGIDSHYHSESYFQSYLTGVDTNAPGGAYGVGICYGFVTDSASNVPYYYSVVWVMRVK